MAVGLSPKHLVEFPLNDLTPDRFLVIALEAAKKLEWNIGISSDRSFIAYTKFSMSSWSEEVQVNVVDNKAIVKSECTGNQITDWGKNKRNIEDFVSTFRQIESSITSHELSHKVEEYKQSLVSNQEDLSNQTSVSRKENISDVVSIFKPTQGYFITPILINLNIVIFIIMAISGVSIFLPHNESLLKWGANFKPLTLEGEWWRLITCCFIHIGIWHLLMNLYALQYIGALLEPYLGKARFIAAYLLSGIIGSMTSLYWHEFTISAGASGAIFGMYGVFLAMLTTNLIEKAARKTMLTSITFFVGFNLLLGVRGGIDNAAHIGGLIGGLLIGYAYYPSLMKAGVFKLKYLTIGSLTILILFTSLIVYSNVPNKLAEYDRRMEKFTSMESMALEMYNMPENTPKEDLLVEIKDRGIYYWKENIKLLNDLDKLNLPKEISQRNNKLKQYCQLRIKSYELIYKQVAEESQQYKEQIEGNDKQIEAIIDELSGKTLKE